MYEGEGDLEVFQGNNQYKLQGWDRAIHILIEMPSFGFVEKFFSRPLTQTKKV
jgi:hypothetical protein